MVLRVLSPVVHAICFVEPKHYALCLRCREFNDVLSVGAERCPHWQHHRLCHALHLQPSSTTSVQNVASILERQVPFSFAQSLLCVMLGTSFFLFHSIHDNNTSECRTLHEMNRDHASWDERTYSLFLELITQQKNLCH